MPHDFDDEQPEVQSTEFDEDGGIDISGAGFVSEDVGVVAEEFVANITRESNDTASMSEAERRLDLAGYYRQLIHGFAFESEEPGARQVEGELRAFAEGRLQVLLGIRPYDQPRAAAVKPQFTDEEATALRKFAAMTEAERKVLWALLATAARSKSVVGAPPIAPPKPQPAPVKIVAAQPQAKPVPGIRRLAAPNSAQSPSPAPRVVRPAPAPQPAPRTRPPVQQPPQAPEEPAPPPPPKPLRMPRGKAMEGVMMHTAISQTQNGERMDESYRRRGDPDSARVQR
jgi:hypothetical protein